MTVDVEARKKALRFMFQQVIDPLGYKFTSDVETVDICLEGEVMLEQKHGIPFCPCQPVRPRRAQAMTVVCPCIPFHRLHYDAMKRCWCGLFVHKDITDPSQLKQIPPSEVPHAR